MKTQAFKVMFLLGLGFFAWGAQANYNNTNYYSNTYSNYSGSACNFSRDLMQGMRGEDVRCLQQYLKDNSQGTNFVYPDGAFGSLTRQAVMNWQMNQGISATGVFDSFSRTKYFQLTGNDHRTGGWNVGTGLTDPRAQKAANKISDALQKIDDAQNEIDDSNKSTTIAESDLADAKDDLIRAVTAFFVDRDFAEAFDMANSALDNADNAFEEAGGSSHGNREDAKNAINDAQDEIDNAKDDIDNADRRGADVSDAQDTLDRAENKLDDARNKYDDKNYSKAEEWANDAQDLAQQAVDDINW